MSIFLDHKYVNLVSSRLDKFKRKNQKTYNCRCIFCGDSSKSKIKARGYFYQKENSIFYKCFNCLVGYTLATFLKNVDPKLYEEYTFDKYREGSNAAIKKPEFEFEWKKPCSTSEGDKTLSGLDKISDLPSNHIAVKYLQARQIPEEFFDKLYFTDDFKGLIDRIEPENQYQLKEMDKRIVIPFFDFDGKKVNAIQGRVLEKYGIRYITIKVDKDAPKLFGLERIDVQNPVYLVEGPFDSLFLPNALASAGAVLGNKDLSNYGTLVFVYDNEPRNRQILEAMVAAADKGYKVCVWPETIKEKDINDMILSGMSKKGIKQIIDSNTFSGLEARIKITEWKRC